MKRTKCEECGGKITNKIVNYDYLGENIDKYKAEVCSKCGEVVFDEEVSEKIERKVKEKGLYGLDANTKVGIAGSSLMIRITKKLANFLKLEKGEDVHVYPESKKRLVIEISK